MFTTYTKIYGKPGLTVNKKMIYNGVNDRMTNYSKRQVIYMASLLEEKRKEMGLTQEEIAHKLNITRQYYNAIENMKRKPSVELAKKLGDLLELDWTYFFNDRVNN